MNKIASSFGFDLLRNASDKRKSCKLTPELKSKMKKVAFDVVRFMDNNDVIDGLWKIHREGNDEYIVAMYDEDQALTSQASAKPWQVVLDSNTNINIFYKNHCLGKFASKDLGISDDEIKESVSFLPNSLSQNKNLVSGLLKLCSINQRKDLVSQFKNDFSEYLDSMGRIK